MTSKLKAFDFFFKVRSYGADSDKALEQLIEELNSSLENLFIEDVNFEEVNQREADQAVILMESYAQDAMLENTEPAEA